MTKVNVASLKSELSKYLEIVKQGEEIVITSHGEEIARLVPYENVEKSTSQLAGVTEKHHPLKPLKKAISSAKIIRQIRDEE